MIPRLLVVGGLVALAIGLWSACKDEPPAIATLIQTSPGTEKETGDGPWAAAADGAKFHRGDAIRTGDQPALLELSARASLRAQPHSLIRFGAQGGKSSIDVLLGEATLEGTGGSYQLGAAGLALDGRSSVRIVAGADGPSYTLVLGKATLDQNGLLTSMQTGKTYQGVKLGDVEIAKPDAAPPPDAALPDAVPVDAPPPPPPPETVALVVSGKKASFRPDGETKWQAMPAGASELPAGTSLRLGARTSAVATRPGIRLALPTGSALDIGGSPFLGLAVGKATATGAADAEGAVALPGGHVILHKGATPTSASLEIKGAKTKVTVTHGELEIVGKSDRVGLERGETAVLSTDGSVEIIDKIPKYFDLRVAAGESFTIHDPRPGTAVRFGFECKAGGSIELVKDGAKRTTSGTDGANAMLAQGKWTYRQRCDGSGKIVKKGAITVRRDDAHRELPRGKPMMNRVKADGIKYTISYQNLIPDVELGWRDPSGDGIQAVLAKGGKKKTFAAPGGVVVVPAKELRDGVWTFYFTNAAGQRSKTSSLDIRFDPDVPSVYIEAPSPVGSFGGQLEVSGATLPGWSVSIDGAKVDVDGHGRFELSVGAPSANALAIRFSHPSQGVHYYLRRHP